jgi:5-methylcytosine-specific restriction endonuclease McrA
METLRALTDNLAALLRHEHDALAEFLVALADFDRSRAWAELGYVSLFHFLHRELHLSKGAAQYRKVAAELIQDVPAVVEPLRSGQLCLTSIIEAAKVVTAENWETVLPRFYGLSKRDAMEVVAAIQPHPAPPVRTVITAAAPAASRAAPAGALGLDVAPQQASESGGPAAAPGWPDEPSSSPPPAPRPAELVPLSAEASRLHVTVSKRFARKLAEARDAHADLTDEELLETGLDLLLAQVAKRRGDVERPRKDPRPSKPDHIPAHLRRAVWQRDGGRCQFRLANGELCGCTRDLQIDHVEPLARGGATTLDNLRLTCRPHNLEAARRVFGDALMDRYARPGRRRLRVPPASSLAVRLANQP